MAPYGKYEELLAMCGILPIPLCRKLWSFMVLLRPCSNSGVISIDQAPGLASKVSASGDWMDRVLRFAVQMCSGNGILEMDSGNDAQNTTLLCALPSIVDQIPPAAVLNPYHKELPGSTSFLPATVMVSCSN